MSTYYLEFEKPIQEIDEEIHELRSVDTVSQDIKDKIVTLESKRIDLMKKIFSNLNRWQKVQRATQPFAVTTIAHRLPCVSGSTR